MSGVGSIGGGGVHGFSKGSFGPEGATLEGDAPTLTLLTESDTASDQGELRFQRTAADGTSEHPVDANLGAFSFEGRNTDGEWFTGATMRVSANGAAGTEGTATNIEFRANDGSALTTDGSSFVIQGDGNITFNPVTNAFINTPGDIGLNATSDITIDAGGTLALSTQWGSNAGTLDFDNLTADRTFTFPDASGTLALTSNLSAYQPLDSDLTTLSTAFTTASASGAASLKLAEDTDNGTNTVALTGPATIASDKTVTFQDVTGTVYVTGGTDVSLADGGTGASLTDPNADRILFWDDSAGQVTWLAPSNGLSISGTTLSKGTHVREIVLENEGSALYVGQTFDIVIPNACTISSWTMLGNQLGSLTVDLASDSYANYPPHSSLWVPGDYGTQAKFWFKAEDATGSNGNAITAWSDASGTGATASSSAWPTFRSNDLNGYPTIDFGTSKHVQVASTISSGSTLTAFVVARRVTSPAASSNARVLSLTKAGSDDYNSANRTAAFLRDSSTNDAATYHNSSARVIASGSMPVDTWKIWGTRFNGTALATWHNGTAGGTFTVTSPSWDIDTAMLGAEKQAGGTITSYFNGKIAEVVCWATNLADADIDKVNGSLHWKYGLQANLPGGHTYLSAPPTTTGDSIVASAPPTISSALKGTDSTLTGWTTSLAAGSVLRATVTSVTNIERATLALVVQE